MNHLMEFWHAHPKNIPANFDVDTLTGEEIHESLEYCEIRAEKSPKDCAPVAQLDRASDYGSEG